MVSGIFSALGMATAGPLGAALGGVLGRSLEQTVGRARSRPFFAATSAYGSTLPRVFGRARVGGTCIWAEPMQLDRSGSGGRQAYVTSLAVALSSRPANQLGRIWADGREIRSINGETAFPFKFRFYSGRGRATPDPLLVAAHGEAAVTYPGIAYVVLEDFPLIYFRNRLPALSFEVIADYDTSQSWIEELAYAGGIAGAMGGADDDGAEGYLATEANLLDELKIVSYLFGKTLTYIDGRPVISASKNGLGRHDQIIDYKDTDLLGHRHVQHFIGSLSVEYMDIDRNYEDSIELENRRIGVDEIKISSNMICNAEVAKKIVENILNRHVSETSQLRVSLPLSALRHVSPGKFVRLLGAGDLWRVEEITVLSAGVDVALRRCRPLGTA